MHRLFRSGKAKSGMTVTWEVCFSSFSHKRLVHMKTFFNSWCDTYLSNNQVLDMHQHVDYLYDLLMAGYSDVFVYHFTNDET